MQYSRSKQAVNSHRKLTPLVQGLFYVGTGLWPILHMRSFEAIAGKKTDKWLVKTMGGLITAVGVSLVVGQKQKDSSAHAHPLAVLGMSSALALAIADVVFVSKRRIPPVYLLDAVAETALLGGWLAESERLAKLARPRGHDEDDSILWV